MFHTNQPITVGQAVALIQAAGDPASAQNVHLSVLVRGHAFIAGWFKLPVALPCDSAKRLVGFHLCLNVHNLDYGHASLCRGVGPDTLSVPLLPTSIMDDIRFGGRPHPQRPVPAAVSTAARAGAAPFAAPAAASTAARAGAASAVRSTDFAGPGGSAAGAAVVPAPRSTLGGSSSTDLGVASALAFDDDDFEADDDVPVPTSEDGEEARVMWKSTSPSSVTLWANPKGFSAPSATIPSSSPVLAAPSVALVGMPGSVAAGLPAAPARFSSSGRNGKPSDGGSAKLLSHEAAKLQRKGDTPLLEALSQLERHYEDTIAAKCVAGTDACAAAPTAAACAAAFAAAAPPAAASAVPPAAADGGKRADDSHEVGGGCGGEGAAGGGRIIFGEIEPKVCHYAAASCAMNPVCVR